MKRYPKMQLNSENLLGMLCFLKYADLFHCVNGDRSTFIPTSNDSHCDNPLNVISDILKLKYQESEMSDTIESKVAKSRTRRTANASQFIDELFGKRLFNTTMNFIVPGAKVNLPRHTEEGNVDHLAMQAFFGIFWAIAWISTIAIPWATIYYKPFGIARSLDDGNHGFHVNWKLNEKLSEEIGLKWTPCLQKAICQAHEFPQKYGVLGLTVKFLFPYSEATSESNLQLLDEYDEAAAIGSTEKNCAETFKCFFDVLDVLLYMKNAALNLP